jgi:hypothetical protein
VGQIVRWACTRLISYFQSFLFLFLFFHLRYSCEVTSKNNYLVYLNIFLNVKYYICGVTPEFQEFSSKSAIFYHLNEFLRVYQK